MLKPSDKASFGLMSELPGCNVSAGFGVGHESVLYEILDEVGSVIPLSSCRSISRWRKSRLPWPPAAMASAGATTNRVAASSALLVHVEHPLNLIGIVRLGERQRKQQPRLPRL